MIELIGVSKFFNNKAILENINLTFRKGEFISILGESGVGKSTLLKIISGIYSPTKGEVNLPNKNRIGIMLQENILLEWRTLYENATLGVEIMGGGTKEELQKYLQKYSLEGFENYFPKQLSGGMKQRLCLIRTLLLKPNVILIDEGFANLDFDTKLKIQSDLLKYQKENSATIINVTHDIEDSIALSDYIYILKGKPAKIKFMLKIDLDLAKKDPIEARKQSKFSEYFTQIWNELKL